MKQSATKKTGKKRQISAPSAAELALEDQLFGKKRVASSGNEVGSGAGPQQKWSDAADEVGASTAAWVDEETDTLQVDLSKGSDRLRKLKTSALLSSTGAVDGETINGSEFTNVLQERFATQKTLLWATTANTMAAASAVVKSSEKDVANLSTAELLSGSAILTDKTGSATSSSWFNALAPGKINIQRVVNGNASEPSKKSISCVQFYGGDGGACELLLTGGSDKTLRFFKIDGEKNPKQLSVKFNDIQIHNASFLGSSSEVLVSGRKPYYYSYDTVTGTVSKITGPRGKNVKSLEHMVCSPTGQWAAFAGAAGHVHVTDTRSKSWIFDVKMNTAVRSMCFAGDGSTLVTSGVDADVYIWDLRFTGRCVNRFHHDDGMCTSSLASFCPPRAAAAGAGRPWCYGGYSLETPSLAVGSESGVVSLFDGRMVEGANKISRLEMPSGAGTAASMTATGKPKQSIFNLTTKITSMAYHPSGQVLALASSESKDQLKLVHMPSRTVFTNWPTHATPLGHVEAISFSNSGAYFAVGTSKGRVLMYRMNSFATGSALSSSMS